MIKKITTQAFLSAKFIMSVIPVTHAKEPEFKSELFKKGIPSNQPNNRASTR